MVEETSSKGIKWAEEWYVFLAVQMPFLRAARLRGAAMGIGRELRVEEGLAVYISPLRLWWCLAHTCD